MKRAPSSLSRIFFSAAVLFAVVTSLVRRYLKQATPVPSGGMNALEYIVEFVRDSIVAPNVGNKWVNTWTPLLLTFFLFILTANAMGMVPMNSDTVLWPKMRRASWPKRSHRAA